MHDKQVITYVRAHAWLLHISHPTGATNHSNAKMIVSKGAQLIALILLVAKANIILGQLIEGTHCNCGC